MYTCIHSVMCIRMCVEFYILSLLIVLRAFKSIYIIMYMHNFNRWRLFVTCTMYIICVSKNIIVLG